MQLYLFKMGIKFKKKVLNKNIDLYNREYEIGWVRSFFVIIKY